MDLPKLENLAISGKKVLVRADLDVDIAKDDFRLKTLIRTINYLAENKAKIIIIGHKGRPEGKLDNSLSLRPVAEKLGELLGKKISFVSDDEIMLLENLRFDPREEANDESFAKELAGLGDLYVNEAFADSHREHASIVGIPKLLPHAAGLHFVEEVENLAKVFENPRKPVVVIIGGLKKDKLDYLDGLENLADRVLVGGRLPDYVQNVHNEKVLVANLMPDKEDLTINSMDKFAEEIKKAKTIVLAGPMGKFEDEGHRQGTQRVFKAVVESNAFKVAGGGDTELAINLLAISYRFDWISTGGGAMLEFLANRTLPGIKALEA